MLKTLCISATLALFTVACGSEAENIAPVDGGPVNGAPKAQTVAVPSGVHEVRCGCKIDSVGHCGNYVDVEGEWLTIANPADHGLGRMEWCSAEEKVEATVAGTRTDDAIHLTQLEVKE